VERPIKNTTKLKKVISKSLDEGKADDIVVLDLKGKSSLADFFIIATGTSQRHITSLADNLADKILENGFGRVKTEGKLASDWVVIDAGNIMIHLFKPEARGIYNLEGMWSVPNI